MHEVRIFPEVTTSKEEFIKHIQRICATDIYGGEEKEWMDHVRCTNFDGYYFLNLIYLKFISAPVLLHEIIHHIFQQLDILTNSNHFTKTDVLVDKLHIAIFKIIYRKYQK